MFSKLVRLNHKIVTSKPKTVLTITLVLIIIAGILASGLSLELSWTSLAPKTHPSVAEYQQIMDDFPTLSNVMVIIEAEDYDTLETIALEVDRRMNQEVDYVESVTVGIDQDFAIDYALNMLDQVEAGAIGYTMMDPNFDSFVSTLPIMIEASTDMLENEQTTAEERLIILNQLRELNDLLEAATDGLNGNLSDQDVEEALKGMISGPTLMTSDNGQMTMIMVQPSFDMMDMEALLPGVEAMENIIFDLREEYPEAEIGITGMHVVARDETASIMSDSQLTTLIAIALILLILYIAFRALMAPLFMFVPLLVGVIWDIGLIRLAVGRLNMLTAFSAAMIIGLGIDYAIHLYSAYTEQRASGLSKEESLSIAMTGTGPSIVVGGLTTAAAFLALNTSQLEMLGELGTVMGIGIACTLIAVFWVLPALIMVKKEKEGSIKKIKGHYPIIGKVATGVRRNRIIVAILLIIGTIFMASQASKIEFDMNLLNLEPVGLESIALMERMVDDYDLSTDSLSLEVTSLEEVYRLEKAFKQVDGVGEVSSIAMVLPDSISQKRLKDNKEILGEMLSKSGPVRTMDITMTQFGLDALKGVLDGSDLDEDVLFKDEVDQLYANLDDLETALESANDTSLEALSKSFYDNYKGLGQQMSEGQLLTVDKLPDAYKNQFVNGDQTKYLMNVYPDFEIWSNLKSDKGRKFIDDLSEIDDSITGTPLFMKVIYEVASSDTSKTLIILGIVLFSIVMVHFRSVKLTLLAFLPLIGTLTFTVGTMVLLGVDFNMINFLGVLLIIGIGIDDGVHILHHYQDSTDSIHHVFSSVGRAILLTTLTTMCGFGSLIFSSYRGVASLGLVLFIGVIYAFIMTVLILPIFMKLER